MRTQEERATWFLPADRADPARIAEEIRRVSESPLVNALLSAQGCALVLLNKQRQVVAFNTAYLELLGVADPSAVLALRIGESLGCSNVCEAPSGCGTGQACKSCGAALATAAGLAQEGPAERECCIHVAEGERAGDYVFRIWAAPLPLDGVPFLLLSLNDITADKRRAALERVFLDEVLSLGAGLQGACELLALGPTGRPHPGVIENMRTIAGRLVRELEMTRLLGSERPAELRPASANVGIGTVMKLVRASVQQHPSSRGKTLEVTGPADDLFLFTDGMLLQHVLLHMLVNALEATARGGRVRLVIDERPGEVAFRVWNEGAIPPAVRPRVFQRYFSTKPGDGRGQGTYAIRLFGERCLNGRVTFSSSDDAGTWFELVLPRGPLPVV